MKKYIIFIVLCAVFNASAMEMESDLNALVDFPDSLFASNLDDALSGNANSSITTVKNTIIIPEKPFPWHLLRQLLDISPDTPDSVCDEIESMQKLSDFTINDWPKRAKYRLTCPKCSKKFWSIYHRNTKKMHNKSCTGNSSQQEKWTQKEPTLIYKVFARCPFAQKTGIECSYDIDDHMELDKLLRCKYLLSSHIKTHRNHAKFAPDDFSKATLPEYIFFKECPNNGLLKSSKKRKYNTISI